jgi:hypothetical protein
VRLPGTPGARDKLVATVSSVAVIGAARTCNFALRRLQLASLAHAPLSFVNYFNSSLCAFDTRLLRPRNSSLGPPRLLLSLTLLAILNCFLNGLGASRPLASAVENCGGCKPVKA